MPIYLFIFEKKNSDSKMPKNITKCFEQTSIEELFYAPAAKHVYVDLKTT